MLWNFSGGLVIGFELNFKFWAGAPPTHDHLSLYTAFSFQTKIFREKMHK